MKLCLGTVQFGLDYGIQGNGRIKKEAIFEMISFAVNNGIEIFDTASVYGDAEKVLGEYIRTYPDMAERIGIVSKLKPDALVGNDSNIWAEIALTNAKESLERLGIKKLFAYLFHNASFIFNEDAVNALDEVKKSGIAERIGVSIYTSSEAMKALEYSCIGVIQIPYNLFDHRLDKCGFFQKAKDQGVLVFARSSLLQGLLMMDPYNLPDRVLFSKVYLDKFHDLCDKYECPPLRTAIGYVGCKPGIDYVVFGVDNIDQLKEYVDMKNNKLSEDMLKDINRTFDTVEEKLVNPVLWK